MISCIFLVDYLDYFTCPGGCDKFIFTEYDASSFNQRMAIHLTDHAEYRQVFYRSSSKIVQVALDAFAGSLA
jgi:hypothetical protein